MPDNQEHAAAAAETIDIDDLGLAEHARSAAAKLMADFPAVVFTSGRRTVAQQADAMAANIVQNRQWIKQTYAQSAERDALQKWVDDYPEATSRAAISTGLQGVMANWTDAKLVRLSRHIVGLAFDVKPTGDANLKEAIRALPNLVKFLDSEGGITIWHAEFRASE